MPGTSESSRRPTRLLTVLACVQSIHVQCKKQDEADDAYGWAWHSCSSFADVEGARTHSGTGYQNVSTIQNQVGPVQICNSCHPRTCRAKASVLDWQRKLSLLQG